MGNFFLETPRGIGCPRLITGFGRFKSTGFLPAHGWMGKTGKDTGFTAEGWSRSLM